MIDVNWCHYSYDVGKASQGRPSFRVLDSVDRSSNHRLGLRIPVVIRYQTQIGPHHQTHSHRLLLILVPVAFSPLDLPTPPAMPNTSNSQAMQCNLSSHSGNALTPAIFPLPRPPEDCAMCPDTFKSIPLASLLRLMPSWLFSRQVEGTLSFTNSHG